jgi:hypothetical protein
VVISVQFLYSFSISYTCMINRDLGFRNSISFPFSPNLYQINRS